MWQGHPNPSFANLPVPSYRRAFHSAEAASVQALLLETSEANARCLALLHGAEAEAEGAHGPQRALFSRQTSKDPLVVSTICTIQIIEALVLLRGGSLLKGGYHLRRAWKSVERAGWPGKLAGVDGRWAAQSMPPASFSGPSFPSSSSFSFPLAQGPPDAQAVEREARADLAYARGGFLFCVSLCPPKFRWLISALGMEADQVTGKALLVEAVLSGGTRLAHALHLLLWMEIFYFENEPRAQVVLACCLRVLPGVPTVLFMEGYLHREAGRLQEAEEAFKRGALACASSPQMSANMTYELGWCALLRLDWAEAAALLGSFCERSKSRSFKAYALYQLGLCRHFQGLPLEAEAAFAQVAAFVRPNFSFDEYARRKAAEYVAQGRRWRQGEDILVLAGIHAEAKRHDEVIRILEGREAEAGLGGGGAEEALHRRYLLGMARAGRREVAQARSLLGAVVAGAGSLRIETWLVPWALFGLAELERLQGHLHEARTLCQRALSDYSGYDLDKPLIRKLQARITPGVFEDKPDDPTWRLKSLWIQEQIPGLEAKPTSTLPQPPSSSSPSSSSSSSSSVVVTPSSSTTSLSSFFSAVSTEEEQGQQIVINNKETGNNDMTKSPSGADEDESRMTLLPRSTTSLNQMMMVGSAGSVPLRSLKQLVATLGEAGHVARWSPDVVLGRGPPPQPTSRDAVVGAVRRLLEDPSFERAGLEGSPEQVVGSMVAEGLLVPVGAGGGALLPREAMHQKALNLYGLPEAPRSPRQHGGAADQGGVSSSSFSSSSSSSRRRGAQARTAEQISLSLILGAHAAMDDNLVPGENTPDWGTLRRSPWLRDFVLALGELTTFGDPVYPPAASSMVMTLINLYNVLVFLGHVFLGPPTTLLKRRRFFGPRSPLRLQLGGHMYSIDDIEHGLLRCNRRKPFTLFRPFGGSDPRAGWALPSLDPRVHFALNSGGSSLRFFYSSGDRVSEGLDWIATEFIRKEVSITPGGALSLPAIFHYYIEDFGGTQTALALFVAKYAEQGIALAIRTQLARQGHIKIVFKDFKWDCWFKD